MNDFVVEMCRASDATEIVSDYVDDSSRVVSQEMIFIIVGAIAGLVVVIAIVVVCCCVQVSKFRSVMYMGGVFRFQTHTYA